MKIMRLCFQELGSLETKIPWEIYFFHTYATLKKLQISAILMPCSASNFLFMLVSFMKICNTSDKALFSCTTKRYQKENKQSDNSYQDYCNLIGYQMYSKSVLSE